MLLQVSVQLDPLAIASGKFLGSFDWSGETYESHVHWSLSLSLALALALALTLTVTLTVASAVALVVALLSEFSLSLSLCLLLSRRLCHLPSGCSSCMTGRRLRPSLLPFAPHRPR